MKEREKKADMSIAPNLLKIKKTRPVSPKHLMNKRERTHTITIQISINSFFECNLIQ